MEPNAQGNQAGKGQPRGDHRHGRKQALQAAMDQPGDNAGDQRAGQHSAQGPEAGENDRSEAVGVEARLAEIQMKTHGGTRQCAGQRPAELQQPDGKPLFALAAG